MKKKLLICVNDLNYLYSHRKEIVRFTLESGFEVHLAAPKPDESIRFFESLGCKIYHLDINRKGMNPMSELKLLFSFYRLFKQLKPDLIFAITIKPYLYGGIAARLASVPAVVYAVAGLGVIALMPKHLQKLLFMLFKTAFAHPKMHIIFQNLEDRSFLIEQQIVDKQQPYTRFFGAGVDLEQYSYTPPTSISKTRFLFASRLLKPKGIIEFLKASEQLYHTNNQLEFVIAGAPDFDNLESISEAELEYWKSKQLPIYFLGKLNALQMIEQYQQSDVFVLPTYYGEGIPKVLIEASAIGRPCITSNHPGCRDIVQDQQTGLLVEPKNIQQLVLAMQRLAEDKALCQSLGDKARSWVEQHSNVAVIAREHIELFQEMISHEP